MNRAHCNEMRRDSLREGQVRQKYTCGILVCVHLAAGCILARRFSMG